MSVKRICEVIMRDEKSILPVSHMIHGVYEIDDVVLSMLLLLVQTELNLIYRLILVEKKH